jgi:hypothetical protein
MLANVGRLTTCSGLFCKGPDVLNYARSCLWDAGIDTRFERSPEFHASVRSEDEAKNNSVGIFQLFPSRKQTGATASIPGSLLTSSSTRRKSTEIVRSRQPPEDQKRAFSEPCFEQPKERYALVTSSDEEYSDIFQFPSRPSTRDSGFRF